MTTRKKAIEQASEIYQYELSLTPALGAKLGRKFRSIPELMADFAIEYAKKREKDAFNAARTTEKYHPGDIGGLTLIYPTFDDYITKRI